MSCWYLRCFHGTPGPVGRGRKKDTGFENGPLDVSGADVGETNRLQLEREEIRTRQTASAEEEFLQKLSSREYTYKVPSVLVVSPE